MEVYGLTGGIGSGKSAVAEMLEEYGIPVVSADELSRMVVAPGSEGLADVVKVFGDEVLDGAELDRKRMGRIVFKDPEKRRALEAILHPRIRERYEQVLDALEKAGHPVMIYEVPLLFEKRLDEQDEMKSVILVTASAEARIARVRERDQLTTDEVLSRMRAQMPEEDKRKRADYIIHNEGTFDDLRREVEYLISRFLKMPVSGPARAEPETPLPNLLPHESATALKITADAEVVEVVEPAPPDAPPAAPPPPEAAKPSPDAFAAGAKPAGRSQTLRPSPRPANAPSPSLPRPQLPPQGKKPEDPSS